MKRCTTRISAIQIERFSFTNIEEGEGRGGEGGRTVQVVERCEVSSM